MTPRMNSLIAFVLFGMLQYGFAQGSPIDDLKQLRAKAEQGDAKSAVQPRPSLQEHPSELFRSRTLVPQSLTPSSSGA